MLMVLHALLCVAPPLPSFPAFVPPCGYSFLSPCDPSLMCAPSGPPPVWSPLDPSCVAVSSGAPLSLRSVGTLRRPLPLCFPRVHLQARGVVWHWALPRPSIQGSLFPIFPSRLCALDIPRALEIPLPISPLWFSLATGESRGSRRESATIILLASTTVTPYCARAVPS
jgi:hypothetical protein